MNASADLSLPGLVAARAAAQPEKTILRRKDRGIWQAVTWSQFAARVAPIGEALLDFDIGRGDTVAVLSETRPEAVYADIAIQGAGAASVAIHADSAAEHIADVLQATGCRLIFVENEEQLDKILGLRDHCPALARIVIFDMKGLREFSDRQCISLAAFTGRAGQGNSWPGSVGAIQPDQPAVIVFSRDEAVSSARSLTHREVMQMVATARSRLVLTPRDERLAVLSMADVTERVWGLYAALDAGCISNYLESADTAAENLQELQPTVLGADAEAWAHLHGHATRSAKGATTVQRILYDWALNAGRAGGLGAGLANLLVLPAVRRDLGLNRIRLAYIGGAPVTPPTLDWARCLGITIQRIDEPVPAGTQAGPQLDPVMQNAHA